MTEYRCNACGKVILFDYVMPLNYIPRHCRTLMLRKVESFTAAKGPKIPSINGCDHSGEKKLCTCKARELLANTRTMQDKKDASTKS